MQSFSVAEEIRDSSKRLFQSDPSVSYFNEPGAAELSAVGISEMHFESKSGFGSPARFMLLVMKVVGRADG